MSKKRIIGSVFVLLFAAALFVAYMLPEGPGVTKANFDKIEEGMTLEEVQSVFGEKGSVVVGWAGVPTAFYHWKTSQRTFNHGAASIEFSNNRVSFKRWYTVDEPLLVKLRRVLHLD